MRGFYSFTLRTRERLSGTGRLPIADDLRKRVTAIFWGQVVAGSNPVSPTSVSPTDSSRSCEQEVASHVDWASVWPKLLTGSYFAFGQRTSTYTVTVDGLADGLLGLLIPFTRHSVRGTLGWPCR